MARAARRARRLARTGPRSGRRERVRPRRRPTEIPEFRLSWSGSPPPISEGSALSSIEDRVRALEERVAALEARAAEPPAASAPPDETGHIAYGGKAELGGYGWEWNSVRSPGALLGLPAAPLAAVLAAAGHPARLEVLRVLALGPRGVADLQAELGLGSAGQLYHHLKALTGAGLVEQTERAVYRLPGRAVFPVLALLAAAADVSRT
ncbi:ArsR/SmtB family transcription factor [Actinomadura flavalba]|uniref:ArsR/SmtB family transcription factor n=1 Tax=Actinomadura flavalba TaxID=1120938 RepID=UPI0003A0CC23|nr:helix-turn-helix domain-containing protein [Actinomadura flavalba]